jgi:hypothetical protein
VRWYEHVFVEGSEGSGRKQPRDLRRPVRAVIAMLAAVPRAGGGIGRRARLRALWTEWSVEVRVLFGALEKPRSRGAFLLSGANIHAPPPSSSSNSAATNGATQGVRMAPRRRGENGSIYSYETRDEIAASRQSGCVCGPSFGLEVTRLIRVMVDAVVSDQPAVST